MKVKIESWKDLKAGDVWLGLTYQPFHGDGSLEREWDSVWFGGDFWIRHDTIDGLIAAGNHSVERKPEKVVLEGKVVGQTLHTNDWTIVVDGEGSDIWRYHQKRVKVTIEPIEDKAFGKDDLR